MYVISLGKAGRYFQSLGHMTETSCDIINATRFHTKEDAQETILRNKLRSTYLEVQVIEVDKKTRHVLVHY